MTSTNITVTETAAPSGDTLTASANTAIATTPQFDNATGVVMQRFAVASDNADNGNVELNSLTLDDTGTATSVAAAKVYIDTVSQATLPGTAVLIGSVTSWNATSTAITLNQGTVANRTVTNGTSKYIYIVYDMASGQAGNTVRSSVTAVGVVAPDSGAGNVGTSNLITLQAAPADPSVITSCAGCHEGYPNLADGTGRNNPEGLFPGSHDTHTNATGYNMACTVCHVSNAAFGHRNGNIETVSPLNANAGSYIKGTSFAQTSTPTLDACSNTYCHSLGIGGTSQSGETRTVPANTSPTWGDNTATCSTCHQAPPNYPNNDAGYQNKRNSHTAGTHASLTCDKCHNQTTTTGNSITNPANHTNRAYNVNPGSGVSFTYTYDVGGGSCSSISGPGGCHGNAQWGVTQIDCISCHSLAQDAGDGAPTRRAVAGEFSMAWSHKRSAGGTVATNDCGVCHMEGSASDGSVNASYHKNNAVDLRDPDTGNAIAGFASFTRNTASATLETWVTNVQNLLCLKCHDALGATSALAQVPAGMGGSALRPFGTAPTHTPGNNVLNVDAHFTTTNATFHPVKGAQNNSYANTNTMVAPWGVTKTPGTPSNGPLISCWDCHTALNTAHGGTGTLRAPYPAYASSATSTTTVNRSTGTLCSLCHQDTVYTTGGGANGSAFGDTGNTDRQHGDDGRMPWTCNHCHGSSWADPGRPVRAQDAHGFNSFTAGGSAAGGATWANGTKPYAFLRMDKARGTGTQGQWSNWRPRRDGATNNASWGCAWTSASGLGACNRSDHTTAYMSYAPGGVF